MDPVSGQLSDDHVGGGRRHVGLRFPVAFRRTGIRFWVILSRSRSWASLAVGLPPCSLHTADLSGVSTFPTSEIRPGRVPPLPRGPRCSTGRGWCVGRPCAASQRPVLEPRWSFPSAGLHVTRHHRGFTCVHPSGLPLRLWPLDGTAALGLDRLSFAPRRYQRRTSG